MKDLAQESVNSSFELIARKLNTTLYWLAPVAVVVMCLFGIWYSQAAPSTSMIMVSESAKGLAPSVSEKMMQYSRLGYASCFIWSICGLAFLGIFLNSGMAGKLRDWAEKRTGSLLLQISLFTIAFALINVAALFPLSLISGFWMEHHFGMSSQSFLDWLIDYGKAFLLGLTVEIPMWFLFFYLVRRFKKGWPYLLFALSLPITLFMTFIEPIVFEPVFNKFELMSSSPLRDNIKVLAAKAKLGDAPIYIVDKHKQTNALNAHVAGIGPSARIVIWDTTLEQMPSAQILCVVAHEIGHYSLNHVFWGCVLSFGIGLIALILNVFVASWFFAHTPKHWGIRSLDDIASIPLMILLASFGGFFSEPFSNYYSRTIEHQADMFGVRLHNDPVNFARSFATLSKANLSDPNPPELIKLWLFSHPSLAERINSVMSVESESAKQPSPAGN